MRYLSLQLLYKDLLKIILLDFFSKKSFFLYLFFFSFFESLNVSKNNYSSIFLIDIYVFLHLLLRLFNFPVNFFKLFKNNIILNFYSKLLIFLMIIKKLVISLISIT